MTETGEVNNSMLIQELGESPSSMQSSQPTNQNNRADKIKQRPSHDPSSKESSPPPPLQPYSVPPTAPTEVTLATLENLIRQATTNPDHKRVLHQTLFNLDPGRAPALFGQFGFDSTFLNAFLDAILSMQSNADGTVWVNQSIALLESLPQCGRFSIAHTFISAEKMRKIFAELRSHATIEQQDRVQQVKRFWIE
jgi:Potential Monad-binding region of RPAP3